MNFSTFKHNYELDVVDIFIKHVNRVRQDTRLSYFERKSRARSLKNSVEAVFIKQRINPKKIIEDRYAVLVLPENDPDGFDFWLALYLCILPSYKIELVLEYYYRRRYFSEDYLNRLEFYVIPLIESDRHLCDVALLERIASWILNQRSVDYSEPEDIEIQGISNTDNTQNSENVKIDNLKSIHIHEVRQDQLFKLLVNYLNSKTDVEGLKKVLNGKKNDHKIKFTLKKISFAHTIYSLKKSEVIYNQVNEDIYDWIIQSFSFFEKNTQKHTTISRSFLKKVFSDNETPQNDDILDFKALLKPLPINSK